MRVLLTGATGLIGPKVLNRLVARGDDVHVLALPDTVDAVVHRDVVTLIEGNIADGSTLAAATDSIDVVIHLAGLLPGADPKAMFQLNVQGTERLLDACLRSGVQRFVFLSSVSVYRPAPFPFMWPLREDAPLAAHGNDDLRNYGQTKIDAEAAIQDRSATGEIEAVILRPPTVYGRGAPYVTELLEQVTTEPWRAARRAGRMGAMQWIHTEDLAEAIVAACTRPDAANEVINVAGGELITVPRLLSILNELEGRRPDLVAPTQAGWASSTLRFDIDKAKRLLGYTPQVTLRVGLKEMVDDLATNDGDANGHPAWNRAAPARRRRWAARQPSGRWGM